MNFTSYLVFLISLDVLNLAHDFAYEMAISAKADEDRAKEMILYYEGRLNNDKVRTRTSGKCLAK